MWSAGPELVAITSSQMIAISGDNTTKPAADTTMSNRRLAI
jgi:hypothetical protein